MLRVSPGPLTSRGSEHRLGRGAATWGLHCIGRRARRWNTNRWTEVARTVGPFARTSCSVIGTTRGAHTMCSGGPARQLAETGCALPAPGPGGGTGICGMVPPLARRAVAVARSPSWQSEGGSKPASDALRTLTPCRWTAMDLQKWAALSRRVGPGLFGRFMRP
jgi:hypothetical protein